MHPISQPPASFSIGELSRRTRVNIETIRYYERIRILPAPPRTASGRRVYGPAESRTLTFIRPLSAENGRGTCGEVREVAARHLADIRSKIADLRAMEQVLAETVQHCDAGELSGCPVIEALSAG